MARHSKKEQKPRYHWDKQLVNTWLKSDRRELNNVLTVRPRSSQPAKSIAWGTGISSQKSFKLSFKVMPIDDIRNPNYVLERQLYVVLEYENDKSDAVTATCYDAGGIFGYGVVEVEAIENLCQSIVEIYEDLLQTNDDQLGPPAKQLKNYLTTVIKKKNAA